MANWLTKAINKVGSSLSGNSDFNIWHNINQAGAGVSGLLKGSIASIPNSLAGAASGALAGMAGGPAGAIAGAIAGAVASGAPVVAQGVVSSVNDYNVDHGYEANTKASEIIGNIASATNIVGKIAGVASGSSNEKVASVAGAVANAADVAGSYIDGVGTIVQASEAAAEAGGVSGGSSVGGALGGGVSITFPTSESGGKVGVELIPPVTGWKKTYIPVTEEWAKTAPSPKKV